MDSHPEGVDSYSEGVDSRIEKEILKVIVRLSAESLFFCEKKAWRCTEY